MALLSRHNRSWSALTDLPRRLCETGATDYELIEEDEGFVLNIEMPGFDREEITLSWDTGVLTVAAEHDDEERDTQKSDLRRFRFPKSIDEDEISATYQNGVLEVRLPIGGMMPPGKEIEVQS